MLLLALLLIVIIVELGVIVGNGRRVAPPSRPAPAPEPPPRPALVKEPEAPAKVERCEVHELPDLLANPDAFAAGMMTRCKCGALFGIVVPNQSAPRWEPIAPNEEETWR